MNGMTEAAVELPNRRREIVNLIFRFQSYFGLIIVFSLAIFISPIRNDANLFLKPNNLLNIILYASETGVLAVGMTLVILVAGIDLSVGSVMALVGCAAGVLLLLGVYPGNVKMAVDSTKTRNTGFKVASFARLPMQLPMIRAALRAARG